VDKLLVALDVESGERALQLVTALRGLAGGFKIGNRLFTMEGPSLVRRIADSGARVFLDLKYHDIPNTVAGAVKAATRHGVWMLNVHTSGGSTMLRAARAAADDAAAAIGRPAPLLIGVTLLTSLDQQALAEIGIARPLGEQVERLAALADAAGLDGVVASAREIGVIRRRCRSGFTIVTPGIRGAADAKADQSRTLSAAEALAAGATYLVVGRPIIAAADPRAAAEQIAAECRAAVSS
jgi:orotidine-5'-phosphate decarboxylase